MSKKLQGNGLFESSRMMLPEHKEAYIVHQQNLRKKARPQLDEQQLERLSIIVAESMELKKEITLVIFGEIQDKLVTGVVTKIERQPRRIKLTKEEDYIWVNMENIVDVML